jgi:hypothetical protein
MAVFLIRNATPRDGKATEKAMTVSAGVLDGSRRTSHYNALRYGLKGRKAERLDPSYELRDTMLIL